MYNLPFDMHTDLQLISLLASGPLWIVGRKDLPASNLKELIAWLKANPKSTAATIGVGSGAHMCLIYFSNETGAPMNAVPYRGAAPAMQDLLAGTIDLFCPEAGQTLSQYRAGSIKAYAVLTEKRWFAAPACHHRRGGVRASISRSGTDCGPEGHSGRRAGKAQRRRGGGARRPGGAQRFNDLGHEVVPAAPRRRRPRSPPTTRPRPTSGGRSSRRPSRRSEAGRRTAPSAPSVRDGGARLPSDRRPAR
jgi:hypothetical protein